MFGANKPVPGKSGPTKGMYLTAMKVRWHLPVLFKSGEHLRKTFLVMNLTTIMFFLGCLTAAAGGSAQGITISVRNAPLENAFEIIKKQSGYTFLYKDEVLRKATAVDVNMSNASLEKVLEVVFRNQPLSYKVFDKTVVVAEKNGPLSPEQNIVSVPPPIDVKGRVLNENGEPVIATVTVKGTNNATSTDEHGRFVLKSVDEKAILVVHAINIETYEIRVNGNTELNVIVRIRNIEAENVKVQLNTGYQYIPKERATGSFSQVSRAILEEQVSSGLVSRLEGTATSLQIDRKSSNLGDRITIRGLSTIIGPRAPLIILDNFPYEGNLENINPNDIEHVTLLKDAAAASIWGSKAGNGVIVITTKKARFDQPVRVDLNVNVTYSEKPNLYALNYMSSSDYIDLEKYLYGVGYYNTRITSTSRPGLTPVQEILLQQTNGVISPTVATARLNELRHFDVRDDFMKWVYQPAVKQQYSIGVRGGSKTQAWSLFAGLDRNKSELNNLYQRVNLRMDNTIHWGKTSIQAGVFITGTLNESGKTGLEGILGPNNFVYPYARLADENGVALPISVLRQGYIDTAGAGRLLNWNYYPLADMEYLKQTNKMQSQILTAGIQRPILPGLKAEIKYQFERQFVASENLQGEESYYARDLVNKFSQINYTTGAVTYKIPRGGVYDFNNQQLQSHNLRGQLNYQQRWQAHEITMLAGGEYRGVDNNTFGDRIYGYNPNTIQRGTVDFTNTYTNFITKSSASIPRSSVRNGTTYRYLSFFSNAAYTLKGKYTLTGSVRNDASNLFGLKTNDKWSPLFSVGGAWHIGREAFYNVSWMPNLKLRAAYGRSGNTDPSQAAVTTISYIGTSPYTQSTYATIRQPPNPSLRPEKVATWNFGLDFGSRNQRIGGTVEYFVKNGYDLFGATPVDYTTVANQTLTQNSANIVTKGIDVELQTVNTTGFVRWSTNLNLNISREKVLKYYVANTSASRFMSSATSLSINPLEGYPVYGVFGYQWGGLDPQNGDPVGLVNGQPSKNYSAITGASTLIQDVNFFGSAFPQVSGSLRNELQWKQLRLSFNLMFRLDYYFRKSSVQYDQMILLGMHHSDYGLRWQKPGDELFTNVPSFVYPVDGTRMSFYRGSSINVRKGDHLRLQYINLSYEFSNKAMMKAGWQQLQIYLNLQNLGLLWCANPEGLDPEYFNNTVGNLPPPRSVSAGIRVGF